jgi:multiple sugar transport system ATP-binding protein
MSHIEVQSVTKAFRSHRVLDALSLEAGQGEIVTIFGPSGAGKTVLLRLVAGIHAPDSGTIRLRGTDITDTPPERRGLGMAFQNFALFPHMSAYDNIASALTARRTPAAEIRRRVDTVAQLLKIGHVLGHAPRELSNGQKQRTALARALVGDPDVLLLDDPLRNVDAKLRYEMRLELPVLLKRSGSSVLYVTQDYKEAMALGDRIAVLLDGRIAQCDAPGRIYAEPATLGVARLFGDPTLNLIEVEPVLADGIPTVRVGGVPVHLPRGYAGAAGRPCTLGLRPEAFHLEDGPAADAIPMELVAVTPLNEKSVLLLKTADGHQLLASEPSEREEQRRPGPVRVTIDPDMILMFERDGGRRIVPATH